MNPIPIRKTLVASSIALALGAPVAEAALVTNVLGAYTWDTNMANFTMLAANGGVVVSGGKLLGMTWDGNAYNASSDYTGPGSAANVTASLSSPFFGHSWTAHDIQVFAPGSYSFDVTLQSAAHPNGANTEIGTLNATVNPGQLGMHMLFDWNGNNNIDVFMVFAQNSIFGSGLLYSTQTNSQGQYMCDSGYTGTIVKNCLYDSPYGNVGSPTKNQVWTLASVDGNGDGVMGIPMAFLGPFAGFNFNFNANLIPTPKAVPVPAAMWLFGSGLMGLLGVAMRRRR